MARHTIKMPDIGEGIAEVEIVEWHVSVGDSVVEDQVLADVMTDKASVEIPSPVAGTVVALNGDVGEIVAVGSELIVIDEQGGAMDHAAPAQASAPVPAPAPTAIEAEAEPEPGAEPDAKRQAKAQAQQAQVPGDESGVRADAVADQDAVSAPAGKGANAVRDKTSGKALASPSVRHRARQLDIDLRDVAARVGDTPISHRDLDEYLITRLSSSSGGARPGHHAGAAPSKVSALQTAAPDAAGTAADSPDALAEKGDTRISVVGLRRQIARKMQESKREVPHFSYIEEIDVTELERARQALNDNLQEGEKRLTLLPFIVRAMVLAVRQHPEVNAHFDSGKGELTQFAAVHMGIATQTDNGLVVPVLHNAHRLDIQECAAQIAQLTTRTRAGKAQRDELTGSTLTLSSLGPLGGLAATPIINHPEVAIVGVNRIIERPVIVDGQLAVRKLMNLSSSFDHRVIDGMNAAQFIQEVRRFLETPALLLAARPR